MSKITLTCDISREQIEKTFCSLAEESQDDFNRLALMLFKRNRDYGYLLKSDALPLIVEQLQDDHLLPDDWIMDELVTSLNKQKGIQ